MKNSTTARPSNAIRPSVRAAALARPHGAEALAILDRFHAEGRGLKRGEFSMRFEDESAAAMASDLLGERVSVARLRRFEEEGR